eukprot:14077832-Alexandrium_andersonii.AAC.1
MAWPPTDIHQPIGVHFPRVLQRPPVLKNRQLHSSWARAASGILFAARLLEVLGVRSTRNLFETRAPT